MEPDSSNKHVKQDDMCYICEALTDHNSLVMWNPIQDVVIVRYLCQTCTDAFNRKTRFIEKQKSHECRIAYKHWEISQKEKYTISNRQHLIPGV